MKKNFLLGRVYFYAGDKVKARGAYQSARAYLERALVEQPQSAFVQLALAEVMAGSGERDEAMRLCERAMDLLAVSQEGYHGPIVLMSEAEIYAMLGGRRSPRTIDRALARHSFFSASGRRSVLIRTGTRFALIRDCKNPVRKGSRDRTVA